METGRQNAQAGMVFLRRMQKSFGLWVLIPNPIDPYHASKANNQTPNEAKSTSIETIKTVLELKY